MSEANIAKLHRDLAALQGESQRQKSHQKQIQSAAQKKLETVTRRLSEITAFDKPTEYQDLMNEKGLLQQVLSRP